MTEIPMDVFDRPEIPEDTGMGEENDGFMDETATGYNNEETSFGGGDTTVFKTPSRIPPSQEIVEQKLSQIYNKLEVSLPDETNPNIDRFRVVTRENKPFSDLEFFSGKEWVKLTDVRTGKPLKPTTIKSRMGGVDAMKGFLNINETPAKIQKDLDDSRALIDAIPFDLEMDHMSNEELYDVVDGVEIITRDMAVNTDLDMREFLGVDNALQPIKGELKNNMAKLGVIDEDIKRQRRKLTETDNDHQKTRLKTLIKNLQEERQARLEIAVENRKEISSQLSRIKQTAEQVLDGDLTFFEKIKLIFSEQGITIVAILTAFGLLIESIISPFTGSTPSGIPPPPSQPNKVAQWFKKKLQALAGLLGRLAGKAAAALPGIIGAIISGVLNLLKSVVGFAASHIWGFLVLLAGLVFYALVDLLKTPKSK
jgi:ribosomal protein S20